MEKLEELKEACRLLEIDIQELISEIIELELSRENLIEELKNFRRELYQEFKNLNKNNSSDANKEQDQAQ